MARTTTVTITDDMGGTGSATPIYFSVNGERYVIDLNKRNTDTFFKRLAPYIESATPNPPGPVGTPTRYKGNPDAALIRDWAREQGIDMPARGRLPLALVERYRLRNA